MALVNAVLTFSLPEDHASDQLIVSQSPTKDGTYTAYETLEYQYGTTKIELEIDDTEWYRLQFFNSKESQGGPLSEPVYGGTYSAAAPFLAVSTTTDGANYATTQDVYEYSGLLPQDVSQDRVSAALRRSRATIDWRTAEMDLDRLETFESEIARRKYNARLRILKEAEINIALGNIYQNLCDDVIIEHRRRGDESISGGTSIGGTSLAGDGLAERSDSIAFMAALSDRYFGTGEQLLSSIDANSIRLVTSEWVPRPHPKFMWPFDSMPRRHYYRGWW